MRFIMKISWEVEAGNALARKGILASTVQSILADLKPEAAYFMAEDGKRGGILVVDITDASQIPALAEPWFLAFRAKVELHPAMTAEDLGAANLDSFGKGAGHVFNLGHGITPAVDPEHVAILIDTVHGYAL